MPQQELLLTLLYAAAFAGLWLLLLLWCVLLQVLTRPLVQEGEEAIPRVISTMQVGGRWCCNCKHTAKRHCRLLCP
jgi:hypothetical protein